MKKIIFILIFLTFSISSICAQKRIAIYVESNVAGNKEILESKISSCIVGSNNLSVMERNDNFLSFMQKEMDYQLSGNVDPSQIAKIGAQFGAQYVLVAYSHAAAGNHIISGKIIHVETSEILASKSRNTNSIHFGDDVTYVSESLIGALKYRNMVDHVVIRPIHSAKDISDGRLKHPDNNMVMVTNPEAVKYLLKELHERGTELFHVIYGYEKTTEHKQINRRTSETYELYYINLIEIDNTLIRNPKLKTELLGYKYSDGKTISNDRFYYTTHAFYCPAHLVCK